MKLIKQLGELVAEADKNILDIAKLDSSKKIEIAIKALQDSVPEHANTLNKLYALLRDNRTMYICENNTERIFLDRSKMSAGDQVFVKKDDDNEWAFYMLIGNQPNLYYERTLRKVDILDPLNSLKIKALYESNPDTNAFTNIEKAYLKSLYENLGNLSTENKESYTNAINEIKTILNEHADKINLLGNTNFNIGTIEDFLRGYGDYDPTIGTLEDFISGFESFIPTSV